MSPGEIRARIVAERSSWIRAMTAGIRGLPLESLDTFLADARTPAAAESYLRRALEALLDLGRHFLAKGFGIATTQYKEIADQLERVGVLDADEALLLRTLDGYRNRMVHFYDEVSPSELYEICKSRVGDIDKMQDAFLRWVEGNADRVDQSL